MTTLFGYHSHFLFLIVSVLSLYIILLKKVESFVLLPVTTTTGSSTASTVLERRIIGTAATTTTTTTTTISFLKEASTTSSNESDDDITTNESSRLPSLIIFDLDGCLWKPEMYELLYLSGRAGAPFSQSPNYETDGTIFTCKNEPVRLLGQVRDVMRELYCHEKWTGTNVGISSRTDQPDWARKLLQKFTITTTQLQQQQQQQQQEEEEEVATAAAAAATSFCIRDVIQGPIEISSDSKVKHFERISAQTGVAMEDILFFDNERGNCREVANLGVVVGYCPDGVTKTLWDLALKAFPIASGKVVGLDIYRYDTLEGANSFYDVDVP